MSDVMQRLGASLGGRYAIEREVGHGGMATVYLARDLRHFRLVAIKVLHPDLAAVVGAERFLREIAIAAQLQHPHILTLIDSGEADGLLFYVMPFVEGESLRDRLTRQAPSAASVAGGALPPSEATRILRDVVDALAHAHRQGVVHRDIKPDNVMLAGRHALVVDFGVAKAFSAAKGGADRPEGAERPRDVAHMPLTSVGSSLGTPAYMAPEQAAADPAADHRVDLYAVGVVAYEMLAGRTPFTGTPQAVLAAHVMTPPEPLERLRPDVPPALARLVMRCLEKEAADRFQTADELLAELEALATPSTGSQPAARAAMPARRKLALLGALAVAGIAAAGWMLTERWREERWAREVAIPEVRRLAELAVVDSAYMLAARAEAIVPGDSTLATLWRRFAVRGVLRTEPAGATVSRTWYRDSTAWEPVGTTPTDSVWLPATGMRYRFEKAGYRPVVLAISPGVNVPTPTLLARTTVVLDRADAPHPEMVRVPGAQEAFAGAVGLDQVDPVTLGDFLVDRHETTSAEYEAFVRAGGYAKREYWEHPVVKDGRALPWEEAMRLFVDRTGRPGPATWEGGAPPAGQGDLPVGGLSWYEAAAYAKFRGKMLPTVFHWARAASVGASQWVTPGSTFRAHGPTKASTFAGMSPYGTFDMAGNVREWCANSVADKRYILGGGWTDEPYQFVDAYAQPPLDRSPINGVRLIAIPGGEPALAAAMRPLEVATRDFSKETPAPDILYETYRRMYDYDPAPLAAKVESRDTTPDDWTIERVSYAAAYGGERIPALLFLPKRHRGPLQTVVYFPGSNALTTRSSATIGTRSFDFILRSGRAVLYPIYKSTYERGDGLTSDYANETVGYRDHVLMWGKDLRRSVDYLATRPEIDTTRMSYYGLSWGGYLGGIMPAIEPRLKAAVLYVAGLEVQRAKPEAEPLNHLPRIRIPVLMLNGQYDHFFPVESSQRPMFERLGTPKEHKRWVVYEGGHNVPREKLIQEVLGWLDRYLGPVK